MSNTLSADGRPPLGRGYLAAGRELAVHRSGRGGPAVVFLPGAGLIGLDYLNVHDEIARRTTCVLYDRAGTGWSQAIALPRSAAEVADELRELLRAAGVTPPYVLVGHSLGGAYARRYAQLFPGEVAGLVLLDPAHEGYLSGAPRQTLLGQLRMIAALLGAALNIKAFYRPMFERMFALWPASLRAILADYHVRSWRRSLQEARNLDSEVLAEIRDGGDLAGAPMVVLTAMGVDPFMAPFASATYMSALNSYKAAIYTAFALAQPCGENRLVEQAGHSTFHTDRPDAVVKSIHDVLDAAPGDTSARRDRQAVSAA